MVRARSPRFFFFLLSLFLLSSLFSLLSHLPGAAASPRRLHFSFFFLFLFFSFFLFFFLFLFFLFVFFLYFYSDFLFLFFLCFFFLLFLSFYFCSYLCFFVFYFYFFFYFYLCLLYFFSLFFFLVFIFASPLLFLSFFLFYFFTLLAPISFLIIQPLADHSFFLFRRQSFPSPPATSRQQQKEKNIGKRIHGGEMASRKRTGSGRKCRGTEWSTERDGNVYYARRDKGEKEMGAPAGGMVSRVELCREASPAAFGGRAGKKGGKRAKSVYVLYAYFFLFFCASLQTQKGMVILCISLCIHKKEKKCICKVAYRKQSWRYACICLCMYFKKVQRLV